MTFLDIFEIFTLKLHIVVVVVVIAAQKTVLDTTASAKESAGEKEMEQNQENLNVLLKIALN